MLASIMEVDETKDADILASGDLDVVMNPKNPIFWMLIDDDDDQKICNQIIQKRRAQKPKFGRGNAASGKRKPYILYQPSTIYQRVSIHHHILSVCSNIGHEYIATTEARCVSKIYYISTQRF